MKINPFPTCWWSLLNEESFKYLSKNKSRAEISPDFSNNSTISIYSKNTDESLDECRQV